MTNILSPVRPELVEALLFFFDSTAPDSAALRHAQRERLVVKGLIA